MLKKLTPHLVAIATFALLTIAYFLPYYQGQTLQQGDVTQWEGMGKEITDWNEKHPDDPALWTNGMFGGMPAYQIAMNYPGNFVTKIVRGLGVIFPDASVLVFMGFVGFYIMLLCFGVSPWLSLAGAIAYGLSSFIFISVEAGHNTKVQAMSLIAPAIGGVVLAYRKNILVGGAVTALSLAMAIDANHLQVVYYTLLVLGILGLYYFITSILEKRLVHFAKASAILVLAGILALGPNVTNLWSTQEYAKETIRGGSSELTAKKEATKGGGLDFEYATRWSYGLGDGEMLSLLIPDIKGGGSGSDVGENSNFGKALAARGAPTSYTKQAPTYWGNQPFTSGPVYFGAAIVFLFIFGLLAVRSNVKWALLALTIFSILLAAGHNTPFFGWLFNLLPMFNKFRTPAMALVIAEVAMPLLALLALNEVLNEENYDKDEILKKLKIAGGITAGIVLLFGVLLSYTYSYVAAGDAEMMQRGFDQQLIDAIKLDRASMLRTDAFRSLFFIAVAFGLVWAFVQQKLTKTVVLTSFAFVFLIDNWTVAKRYLNSDNFAEKTESKHQPSQADLDILRDTDPNYRVYNVATNSFNDAMTSYYHKSVGGYHAAKLIRYQDLIENQISKGNMGVLNMLNTKYFIVPNQQQQGAGPMAQRNPGALGNAWFVNNIQWAENADAEMKALDNFDPKQTAVVDVRYKEVVGNVQPGGDSTATIRLVNYTPNKLDYEYTASAPGVAVFSEIYYNEEKGWNAYLDGQHVKHFRTDYVLRGMALPAGKHKVEFKFEPKSIVTGNKIAYAGSSLLFLFAFGILGFAGFKKYKEIEAEPAVVKTTTKPTAKKK